MRISHKARRRIWNLFIDATIVAIVMGLLIGGTLLLWVSTLEIPDLSVFNERKILQSTKIYDRTGEILLYDLHQDVKRTVVPYENISRHIKNATVAIEDDTFFQHSGVHPFSILRAVLANIQGGTLQGGSTITQQVIKNSVLTQERTITRKVKEWVLALKLERVLSKDEILNYYLNESPYGGTMYGVEEASRAFFGKSASDLTLAEAAYLASLPQAPTYLSPYGLHKDALDARKNLTLKRMKENDFITDAEYVEAKDAVVEFRSQVASGIRAPHFVFYVRDYLARTYGEESLTERGLTVVTTLDAELQDKAESVVHEWALKNEKAFDAENAAIVALDPQSGDILAMVGSRDYFDDTIDGKYNVALADRQPGSAFKPFVYATAFAAGYTPETVVFDLRTQFSTACAPSYLTTDGNCYAPTNYDNFFRGPISFRNALAQSINIPAVKVLYLVGVDNALKTARDLGITTLANKGRYGLTLVLGGGEVKLLEMVGAYGVFAHEGKKVDIQSILSIKDNTGTILEESRPSPQRVLDRQVTLQISDILSDNTARTPAFGANSPLFFPGKDVAVKTGTTNDYRDAWIVGYTPSLVVGAWAGNNDNRPMAKKVAGFIVAPMWHEFMEFALNKRDSLAFAEPEATPQNIKPILRGVWFDQGAVADGASSNDLLGQSLLNAHSILHYVHKRDPRGPRPSNPENDPQYVYWEYPVTLWKNALIGATAVATTTAPIPQTTPQTRRERTSPRP